MIDFYQLLTFGIICIISFIIIIYLIIEENDILDFPLIPVFLATFFFGMIGIIMNILGFELIFTIITAGVISTILFLLIYFGFRSLITPSENSDQYIGKKAIVEIPIDEKTCGRIKIIENSDSPEFPAKSDSFIPKNSVVKIINFLGTIAFVKPLNVISYQHENKNIEFIICPNCNASIDFELDICPYCGYKIE
ncbi:MAG: hypothetical protein ACTSRP_06505 [Candidatus Helarchaeota archaeon]